MIPLNHLRIVDETLPGQYTFYRGNKKSQIDYILTDKSGLSHITNMNFINKDWQISDHTPITLNICYKIPLDFNHLYVRAQELNRCPSACLEKPVSMKKWTFRPNVCTDMFRNSRVILEDIITNTANYEPNQVCDKLLDTLQSQMRKAIRTTRVRNNNQSFSTMDNILSNVNDKFEIYKLSIENQQSATVIENHAEQYNAAVNHVTHQLVERHHKVWCDRIKTYSEKELWSRIDWNGKMNLKAPRDPPVLEDLSSHFEQLYAIPDDESMDEIARLNSEIYIPILDDPITLDEVERAGRQMKKGGYDLPNGIIGPIMTACGDIIMCLMNLLFTAHHPMYLDISLLCALPKKGDLSLPKNYRGIQMMPLLAGWYDRILTNRLLNWIPISCEQTAFKKGKSTIQQIFTIRLIMALCKKKRKKLYIAFFDVEKAFDKVSRLLLLRKIVTLGIGHQMLNALKRIYTTSYCTLQFMNRISETFQTYCGIKRGAHSSVLLFIVFMDGVVDYLKSKCDPEPILDDLHCLLHADDTVIISTDKDKFTHKCNHLIEYFSVNKLRLNISKSAYLIIGNNRNADKTPLVLKSGCINYESQYTYLGVPITDSGSIAQDLKAHLKLRRPSIIVKLGRFLGANSMCPIAIKLKVLRACVNSSLLYGCEAWSGVSLIQIDALHRKVLKLCLGVRSNTPNELAFIETNMSPVSTTVYALQKRFWEKLKEETRFNNDSHLAHLVTLAEECNVPLIRYYNGLDTAAVGHGLQAMKQLVKAKGEEDALNKCGQYLDINPDLTPWDNYFTTVLSEPDRQILTKYRCGAHRLRLETGRWDKTPRNNRLCACGTEVQTVRHVLYRCPIVMIAQQQPMLPMKDFVKTRDCAVTLRHIETLPL